MSKNSLVAVIVIVLLLVGVIIFNARQPFSQPSSQTPSSEDLSKPSSQERVIQAEAPSLLSGFPAGFPKEEEVNYPQSYKYIPANSLEQQSTVEYVSQKTLAENGKTFRDYLASAGFNVSNKNETANLLFYYATKDNNDLSIRIEQKNGQVTVSASYLKR